MADEQTPAPAAPVAEPAVPVTPPPSAPTTPTQDEAATAADNKEWDDATKEFFPGLKGAKKEAKNEQAKSSEEAKTAEAQKPGEPDPNETPEQKAEREAKEAADAEKATKENEAPDTSARDTRLAARENAKQAEITKNDVRKQMFSEVPQHLQDADGDPIRSIEDVMKLINPRTNEPFTEDEAGMWLLSAQQRFNDNIASVEKQIEQIAEVNMDLKDEADIISYEFGELLKTRTDLRDKIWAEFEKTLVKDEKSNIIIKAPVSLERFYRLALEPYNTLAKSLETEQNNQPNEEAIAVQEDKKLKSRADRSDIFSGGKTDTMTEDDKEWDAAATAVFGPKVVNNK